MWGRGRPARARRSGGISRRRRAALGGGPLRLASTRWSSVRSAGAGRPRGPARSGRARGRRVGSTETRLGCGSVETLGAQDGGALAGRMGEAGADASERPLEDLGLRRTAPRRSTDGAAGTGDLDVLGDLTPMQADVLVAGPTHARVQLDERILVQRRAARGPRLGDQRPFLLGEVVNGRSGHLAPIGHRGRCGDDRATWPTPPRAPRSRARCRPPRPHFRTRR